MTPNEQYIEKAKEALPVIEGHLITIKEFLKELFVTEKYSTSRLKDRIDANQDKIDGIRELRSQLSDLEKKLVPEMKSHYWAIEISINNSPFWWTGFNNGYGFTNNIQQAMKYDLKIEAEQENIKWRVGGKITDHCDMDIPNNFAITDIHPKGKDYNDD